MPLYQALWCFTIYRSVVIVVAHHWAHQPPSFLFLRHELTSGQCHAFKVLENFKEERCDICWSDLWSVNRDGNNASVLGFHEGIINLTVKCASSDLASREPFPWDSHSLFGLPVTREHSIRISPINNLTITWKCSSARKSHILRTLYECSEWLKLAKETNCPKARPLAPDIHFVIVLKGN